MKFNYEKYQTYQANFLTARKDGKLNYTIILDILRNL